MSEWRIDRRFGYLTKQEYRRKAVWHWSRLPGRRPVCGAWLEGAQLLDRNMIRPEAYDLCRLCETTHKARVRHKRNAEMRAYRQRRRQREKETP